MYVFLNDPFLFPCFELRGCPGSSVAGSHTQSAVQSGQISFKTVPRHHYFAFFSGCFFFKSHPTLIPDRTLPASIHRKPPPDITHITHATRDAAPALAVLALCPHTISFPPHAPYFSRPCDFSSCFVPYFFPTSASIHLNSDHRLFIDRKVSTHKFLISDRARGTPSTLSPHTGYRIPPPPPYPLPRGPRGRGAAAVPGPGREGHHRLRRSVRPSPLRRGPGFCKKIMPTDHLTAGQVLF